MKKLLLLLWPIFIFQQSFGQKIHYEKSFQIALSKAANQNKIVFVVIDPPMFPTGYSTGLDDPAVIIKYNDSFINYRALITDTTVNQFRRKYQMTIYPAYFFFDRNNNLIYRDDKNASTGKKYLELADNALNQAFTGKTLSNYDTAYKKGDLTASFLKDYIAKREQLGIFDNAKLIDQYVEFLPINLLKDYQTVLFLLKAGPYAYGKTYTLAYTNRQITDSIYKTEPLADRIAINNRIINNTYQEAVKTKNTPLAQNAVNYLRSTYGNSKDYRTPFVNSNKLLLQYYTAVKDTANYLRQASYFYDSFFLNISADSAKKLEKAQQIAQLNILNNNRKVTIIDSPKKSNFNKVIKKDSIVIKQSFFTTTQTSSIANELNNAAYSFYTTGTKNPNYLSKAIIWSRRSILFSPIFAYYDTLAHLLYRYGFYAEAEVNQNTAVEIAKKNAPQEAVRMQKELEKIKKRSL